MKKFGSFHNRFDQQKSKMLSVSEYLVLAVALIPLAVAVLAPVWMIAYYLLD